LARSIVSERPAPAIVYELSRRAEAKVDRLRAQRAEGVTSRVSSTRRSLACTLASRG
jgi:hypothetical protein